MEKTTIEEQIEGLSNLVIRCDNVIKGMDDIIDFDQKQRIVLIEQRAQLNAYIDKLMKPAAISKSIAEEIWDHGPLIAAIDYTQAYVDRETARIEQKLKEQREWKAEHPGHQRQ